MPEIIAGFTAYAPDLARTAPGYDPEHYGTLAGMEANNFWFKARNALILWAIERYCPHPQAYLEVGCGTGYVLSAISSRFPTMTVHGSEVFVEGLSFAARRMPNAYLFQMDACNVPFREEYDLIGAFDVIEHIEDDRRALNQLHAALKPNGHMILTVPQHPGLWSIQDDIAHHARRYSVGELEGKLRDAGFDITWTSSFVSLLLPALVLSRKGRSTKTADEVDPFVEFRLPGWLNTALFSVMNLERMLIKAGIRFPIGGSRIVVAHKRNI